MSMIFSQKQKNRNRGFTVVETLIAIFIISLAITGPLFYVANNFHVAKDAKYRMTAYFLALETLEELKYKRDENIASSTAGSIVDWDEGFDLAGDIFDWDKESAGDGSFEVNMCDGTPEVDIPLCGYLKYNEVDGFHYDSSGDDSIFYRYAEIENITGRPNEKKVTITAGWNDGIVSGEVEVVEFIYNLSS